MSKETSRGDVFEPSRTQRIQFGVWRAGKHQGRRVLEYFKPTLDVLLIADVFACGQGLNIDSGCS